MTRETIATCKGVLGQCSFIFGSPNNHWKFVRDGATDCSGFNFRQCLPVYNNVDLFIGISSGISYLTAAWGANPRVKRIEFCSERNWSTVSIAPHTRLETDRRKFFETLKTTLQEIKERPAKS